MTDANEKRVGRMFLDWVASLPQGEVLRRYRALPRKDRLDVEGFAFAESAAALNSDEPYGNRLEILARCFDAFADADDAPPLLSSANIFRERAHELRHPEEWRNAPGPPPASEGRLRALALASSCWADDATDARLRRIEEVLPELNQLASQAAAEGNLSEQSAIGQDIGDLWKLREELRLRP